MKTPVAFCCHCSTGLKCPICEDVYGREARLIQLLRKAQNRLCNQGDVSEITEKMNEEVHQAIEMEIHNPGPSENKNVAQVIVDQMTAGEASSFYCAEVTRLVDSGQAVTQEDRAKILSNSMKPVPKIVSQPQRDFKFEYEQAMDSRKHMEQREEESRLKAERWEAAYWALVKATRG